MHQASGQLLLTGHIALGIHSQQQCSGRRELQEASDGGAGAGLGSRLKVLPQQDEGDQHGRGFKEVGGAVLACDVVSHDVVMENGDHGVGVGCIGAKTHQHIHVSPAFTMSLGSEVGRVKQLPLLSAKDACLLAGAMHASQIQAALQHGACVFVAMPSLAKIYQVRICASGQTHGGSTVHVSIMT